MYIDLEEWAPRGSDSRKEIGKSHSGHRRRQSRRLEDRPYFPHTFLERVSRTEADNMSQARKTSTKPECANSESESESTDPR